MGGPSTLRQCLAYAVIQQTCQPSLRAYYNLLGGFSHTVFTIKHFFFCWENDVFEKLVSSVHFNSENSSSSIFGSLESTMHKSYARVPGKFSTNWKLRQREQAEWAQERDVLYSKFHTHNHTLKIWSQILLFPKSHELCTTPIASQWRLLPQVGTHSLVFAIWQEVLRTSISLAILDQWYMVVSPWVLELAKLG